MFGGMRAGKRGVACVATVLALLLVVLVATRRATADEEQFSLPEGAEYEPEVALVSVPDEVEAQDVVDALAEAEGVSADELCVSEVCDGVLRVELASGTAVDEAVNDLLDSGVVLDAQPNYCYVAMDEEPAWDEEVFEGESFSDEPVLAQSLPVNDAKVSEQWGLESIHAGEAWSVAKTNGAVTVAVMDLGCDVGHEDLKANVVAPYNAYAAKHGGSTTDVTPLSSNPHHGTHVAGIIAAVSNNGVGVSGVSYNARVMPIKVVDDAGNAYSDALIAAYDYVLRNAKTYNVRVVNLSMAAAGEMPKNDAGLLAKVDEAYAAGIVTVGTAGNRSAQGSYGFPYPSYPADYDKIVNVMGLARSGSQVTRSDQSNYNVAGSKAKNVCAPGSSVYSTYAQGRYGTLSGTSMATPHVSAVLALMFAAKPQLTAAEAVRVLYSTATDLGASGWDEGYGYGEVDAYAAVRAVAGTVGSSGHWRRLAGTDRYATMAAVVGEGFSSSQWAVVATGENYPDALAASALAGARGCPVVLTGSKALSAQASARLTALGVRNVYLMGGTGAVSVAVEQALKDKGIAVERVMGESRQATSLEAMRMARRAGSGSNTVIVATGASFADALSIGPWSYATASPIVLTQADGTLSAEAVAAIKADGFVRRVLLVGGTGVVSDAVKGQLGSYTYERLWGANRYETSKAVVAWETGRGLGWANACVATGQNFPDALAGAALAGKRSSVLLLASGTGDPTVQFARDHVSAVSQGYVLGGQNAVTDAVMSALG